MTSDPDLVAQFRATRDDDVFRQLVERHQRRVFHVALSVLGPGRGSEAEEVAQDVFLQAYLQLDAFRGDAAFSSWLYRMAWNRATDRGRRVRFRRIHVEESMADLREAKPGPLSDALSEERSARVRAAVENLPEVYRMLVRMHYWLERPLAEIQELTGIPEGTVKSYLARARKRLERTLADV